MTTPTVTEISALSAHRRQVALVRWSLLATPEPPPADRGPILRDPLAHIEVARVTLR